MENVFFSFLFLQKKNGLFLGAQILQPYNELRHRMELSKHLTILTSFRFVVALVDSNQIVHLITL